MADGILKLARPRKVASASNRYRIQVLDRAAQIMDCFGFDHKELSVSEIAVHKEDGKPRYDWAEEGGVWKKKTREAK